MSFDSLTYARRLKAAGFSEAQAEALADANRELLMSDLATKDDIAALRGDLAAMEQRQRNDMLGVDQKLAAMDQRLRVDMASMEQRLEARIEALGLRLTIRLGVMMGTAVAILGAIQHLR